MKRLLKWSVILGVLGIGGWFSAGPIMSRWQERNRVVYQEAEVTRGAIVAVVNATGTIKPVRSVQIGSFVSGPILSILVDFNDVVTKGQLLAEIDPRIYDASVARDRATLATQQATVDQIEAKLQLAKNDEKRSQDLQKQNKGFISDSEMDKYKFDRIALAAQLEVSKASVLQAKANLDTSLANLGYTKILSPVDGVVIERKIEPGQTVAASFQTPDLFMIAPDLSKEMHIYASVDETEIGLIAAAQANNLPVRFTVDAYPDELFTGKIFQIRKNSTTTQNVVTYPVLVSASNEQLKLYPGMTANISFQVEDSPDALRLPNAALRFFPPRESVRPEDRKVLDGTAAVDAASEQAGAGRSAEEKAKSRRARNRRHVWAVEGDFLRAIEISTGISDSKYTEAVSEELRPGLKLVTGIQGKN